MSGIVTLTVNPAIDASTRVHQVVPERKLRCAPPRREPGGGGINVSRAIHRLGGRSTALYMAGGPSGELLHRLLAEEGLEQQRVPLQGWTRENLVVLEETSGRQFRFGMPGPEVRGGEWRSCLEALRTIAPPPALVVASGSLAPGMPADFYGRVARLAAEVGARLFVDTSGAALRGVLGAGAFLLKPNLGELQELVGRELSGEVEQVEAARALIAGGACRVLVISLGAGGARVVTGEGSEFVRTPTVPIRSRVGAGDSMVAGIVLGLERGLPLGEAVRLGVAAGAAAVMTDGTELCRQSDVERLLSELAGGPILPLPEGG